MLKFTFGSVSATSFRFLCSLAIGIWLNAGLSSSFGFLQSSGVLAHLSAGSDGYSVSVENQSPVDRSLPVEITQQALDVHHSGMLFDGHNDLPWQVRRLGDSSFNNLDIAQPQPKLHTDIPKLKAGGLKAQFWSVYVPVETSLQKASFQTTMEQIRLVYDMCQTYPDTFEIALTSSDIQRIVAEGKIASLIGVEGGHSIENSLGNLKRLFDRGARYMTLTHSRNTEWADSATDEPIHHGLSDFGREIVKEMNRMGMLVDISHVSEDVMHQVLDISTAPVIFSHSSAKAVNSHPRNVPDAVLKRMSENGGVVMVNFMSGFIVPDEQLAKNRRSPGTIHDVIDHIEHIIKLAGIDHVGLGGDYDGVTSLPIGLEDVSCYPAITQLMLNRGYSPEDIHKLLGGNIMRVMVRCEQIAELHQTSANPNADMGDAVAPNTKPDPSADDNALKASCDLSGVLVNVTRGPIVESRHYGRLVAVNTAGEIEFSVGDPTQLVLSRSALKPLQALATVKIALEQGIELDAEEIAIMCASHAAQDYHLSAAKMLLDRAGAKVADLHCGETRGSRLRHNCSGKHGGMLVQTSLTGDPSERYWHIDHPVQRRIQQAIQEFTDYDQPLYWGIDGCGVPNYALPLYNLALGYARLANPDAAPEPYREAAEVIRSAILAHPGHLSRRGSFDARLIESAEGRLIGKIGAEACYGMGLTQSDVEGYPGLGVAVKIEDGGERGMPQILIAALDRAAAMTPKMEEQIGGQRARNVTNSRGETIGKIEAADW